MPQRTPIPNTLDRLYAYLPGWQVLLLLVMLTVSPGFGATVGNDTPIPSLSDPNLANVPISMNFEQTDIRTVIQTIGDITGINFAMDESVRGNVSVISPTHIPLSDAYRVLERVLDLHGFTAIPSGGLVKIVPKKDAVKHNLPVHIGVDPAEIPLEDTLVTQIMPLTYSSAAEVHAVIRDLLSPDTKVSVYERTNALVITDTSARIHYVAKLIQPLDVPSPGDQVRVFPLEYASAQSLSERLAQILTKAGSSPGRATGARNTTTLPSAAFTARIMPDTRINAVVAIGTSHQLQTLSELVTQLDVPRRAGSENAHVVYLKNAQAKDVAESLTAALSDMRISGGAVDAGPSLQVTADEGTNSLIITGDAPDFEMIDTIVSKLDIFREQVLVEMLIVEVTQEKLLEIGFDWQTINETSSGVNGFAGTNFGPRVDFVSGTLEGLAVGAYKGAITDSTSIAAILAASETDADINLLSQPHVTTQNHTKAKIIVAENRPFVTDKRTPGTVDAVDTTLITSYEYKDVGITLEITPHVNQGDNVRLEISSEISKLLTEVSSNIDTPTTAKRQAETIVTMQSGDTVVIGGLIRDNLVKATKKVPLLGDIPGLGYLFRLSSDEVQKTNLLMFITAHVMNTAEEFQARTHEKSIIMPDMIEKAWHRSHNKLPGER